MVCCALQGATLHSSSSNRTLVFDWNETLSAFIHSDSPYPNLELYENHRYKFVVSSGIGNAGFYLSDIVGQPYVGKDVFNNGVNDSEEYLLLSPTKDTNRTLFYYNPNDLNFSNYGIIRISNYEKSTIKRPDEETSSLFQEANFGKKIILNDWNETIVGAPGYDSLNGAVFIYENQADGNLSQIQTLRSANSLERRQFGSSLATGLDLLWIGSPDANDYKGEIDLFEKTDGNYSHQGTLVDSTGSAYDVFGWSLAARSSVMAASSLELGSNGSGKVSIFSQDSNWSIAQVLRSDDNSSGDAFGYAVAMTDEILVVGAPKAGDLDNGLDSGAVYIFEKQENGLFVETPEKLTSSSLSVGDEFGSAVAISGSTIYAGAKYGDGPTADTGVVYIFEKVEGVWIEQAKVNPPEDIPNQGFSTDLIGLGSHLFVASPGASESGVVYAFVREDNASVWTHISSLDNNLTVSSNPTFLSLGHSPGRIVVGNPEDSSDYFFGGSIQTFYNQAWRNSEEMVLPPIIDSNSSSSFQVVEDENGFTYEFNGSHPFDSDLTWSILQTNASGISFSLDPSSGSFSYIPTENFFGNQMFSLSLAGGGGGEDIHNFDIEVIGVNDPPFFNYGESFALPYGMVGDDYEFEFNATDYDGDSITFYSNTTLPEGLYVIQNKLKGTPIGQGWSYKDHNFTIAAYDGSIETEQNFSIRIHKSNSAPVLRLKNGDGSALTELQVNLDEDFNRTSWIAALSDYEIYDAEGHELTYSIPDGSRPAWGEVEINASAKELGEKILFSSPLHVNGSVQFDLQVTDSNVPSKSSIITFSAFLNPINDPPRFSSLPSNFTAREGISYLYQPEVFDPDFGDEYSMTAEGLPTWMVFDEDYRLFGTPTWRDYREETLSPIKITARDLLGAFSHQEFPLQVIPDNYPPVIKEGTELSLIVGEDNSLPSWEDLYLSATDIDVSGILIWDVSVAPSYGEVEVNSYGSVASVNYLPDGNFTGNDAFKIRVYESLDPNASDEISILVDVQSQEDAPIWKTVPLFKDAIQGESWQYEARVDDGDAGEVLTVEFTENSSTPAWMNVTPSSTSQREWLIEAFPPAGFAGKVSINLVVRDSTNRTTEQNFILSVLNSNSPPVIQQGEEVVITLDEDSSWTADQFLDVSERDDQSLSWSVIREPSHGMLVYSSASFHSLLEVSYVPEPDFWGVDFAEVAVSDGIDSDLITLRFEVEKVFDAPTFSVVLTDESIEDGNYYERIIQVLDADGFSGLTHQVNQEFPAWLSVDDSLLQSIGILKLQGIPSSKEIGIHEVGITLTDETALSNSDSFNLEVYVRNFPPEVEISSSYVLMTEDQPDTWNAPSFLAYDFETPNELTWLVTSQAEGGYAGINPDGSHLSYIPEENFSGLDYFEISVTDEIYNGSPPNTETIRITVEVEEVNDSPVFISSPLTNSAGSIRWNDESPYEYQVMAFDAESFKYGSPQIELLEAPAWIHFEKDGNASGTTRGQANVKNRGKHRLMFKVTDANGSFAIQDFELDIQIDDYPPRFSSVSDNTEIDSIKFFMDEDGANGKGWEPPTSFQALDPDAQGEQQISWSVSQLPSSGGILSVSGVGYRPTSFDYVPPPNFNGVDYFLIRADEGSRTADLPVYVYIRSVPDPPQFVSELEDSYTVTAGTPIKIELHASDPDSSELDYRFFGPPWQNEPWLKILETGPDKGRIVVGGTPPVDEKNKNFPFSVLVSDETNNYDLVNSEVVVEGINQPPRINAGTSLTILFDNEGNPNVNLSDLNAFDAEGDLLTWQLSPHHKPIFGTAEASGSGDEIEVLRYVPNSIEVQKDSFSIRVSDDTGSDDLVVNAVVGWPTDAPFMETSYPPEISPGENFFCDISISYSNELEVFQPILKGGPSWVRLTSLTPRLFRLEGTVPLNAFGSYEIIIQAEGIRSTTQEVSFSLNISDLVPPSVKLFGDRHQRLNEFQSWIEPGYSASDNKGLTLTNKVSVERANEFTNNQVHKIIYRVSDDANNSDRDFRTIVRYDQCPLELNSSSVFEADSGIKFSWDSGKGFFAAGKNLKSVFFPRSNTFIPHYNQNSGFISELSPDLSDSKIIQAFRAENLTIEDQLVSEESIYLTGTFKGNFLVQNHSESYPSSSEKSVFLLQLSREGKFSWFDSFGTTQEIRNLCLFEVARGVGLAGSFSGELKNDLTHNAVGGYDLFLKIYSPEGVVLKEETFGGTADDLLTAVVSDNDDRLILVGNSGEFDNSDRFSNGFVLYANSELVPLMAHSISSSNIRMEGIQKDESGIFVYGSYIGTLEVDESEISSQSNETGFILKFESDQTLGWLREFPSNERSRVVDLRRDYLGDLFAVSEFAGSVKLYDESSFSCDSNGSTDLILMKLNETNGRVFWHRQIGGSGEETLGELIINEVGALALSLVTEKGLSLDNEEVAASSSDNETLLVFKPRSGNPLFLEVEPLKLVSEQFFSRKVYALTNDYCKFAVLESPSWLNLTDHEDGSATLSGVPSYNPESQNSPIKLRAFTLEGGFEDIDIFYQVSESLVSKMGNDNLPETFSAITLHGQINPAGLVGLDIAKVGLYGSFKGEVEMDSNSLISDGKTNGFFLIAENNGTIADSIHFSSSDRVFLRDSVLAPSGKFYVLGNFSGVLEVAGFSTVSRGGNDLFLAEFDSSGSLLNLLSYGGSGDELAGGLALNEDLLFVSGSFWGTTTVGSFTLPSNGKQDAVLFCVLLDQLGSVQWAKSYGGTDIDSFLDLSVSSKGKIFALGNYQNSLEVAGKTLISEGDGSFLLKLDPNGIESNTLDISGQSRVAAKKLTLDSSEKHLLIAGVFDNHFRIGSSQLLSQGEEDFFLAKLNPETFSLEGMRGFGGSGEDSFFDLEMDHGNRALLAAGFQGILNLDGVVHSSKGLQDSVIAKVDLSDLSVLDSRSFGGSGDDVIQTIHSYNAASLFIGGYSTDSSVVTLSNEYLSKAFLGKMAEMDSEIQLLNPSPNLVSAGKPFEYSFDSGPWRIENNEFTIRKIDFPTWLTIAMEPSGRGILSGIAPDHAGDQRVVFEVVSQMGDRMVVDFNFELVPSSSRKPIIRSNSNEVVPYGYDFSFEVEVFDPEGENISITTDMPSWVNCKLVGDQKVMFHGFATKEHLGFHQVIISLEDEIGLMTSKTISLEVAVPKTASDSSNDELGWVSNWFGFVMLTDSGWAFSPEFSWIYLEDTFKKEGFWFWKENFGWLWTRDTYFVGSERTGFVYSHTLNGWIYLTVDSSGKGWAYIYVSQEWIKFS